MVKKRTACSQSKEKIQPVSQSDKKTLSLIEQIEEIVPKPKIDFFAGETDVEVTSIESLIKLSKTKVEFLKN